MYIQSESPDAGMPRRGSALVVTPNPYERTLVVQALRRAGFDLLEAATARDALALTSVLEVSPGVLVAGDGEGVDGLDLARRLAQRMPGVPALLIGCRVPASAPTARWLRLERPVTAEALDEALAALTAVPV